ncbi:hypothetical protein HPP92_015118 [Vanilla planifolia]|uniref:VAN3-binding protein n=1 Tax=Vanilla planifolia TaxID=51239 RepID=A0A835UVE6_VANPL|nr:hypothetical protein HPP92_015118 [Vanilla planifolia]
MEDAGTHFLSEAQRAATGHSREISLDPMEFLSRSWSVSAFEVSATIAPVAPLSSAASGEGIVEEAAGENEEEVVPPSAAVAGNSFSFSSGATSQLVLERIMSQSQEVSPLTSGRLSHSSGPLNGSSLTDSPPVSPTDVDDVKYVRAPSAAAKPPHVRAAGGGGGRTVGRWLKDRREKKKEEARVHNAQIHAAVSLAGVAAAVAAVAAATAAASGSSSRNERTTRTDMAVASAATLVAAQCFEAAEAIGADRDHLAAVVGSAVSVHSPGDIVTLTAAAATALRGAATLRARALREVWNVAAVIPVEKGGINSQFEHRCDRHKQSKNPNARLDDEFLEQENFLGICSQERLARGAELLKRTRKGSLHWKFVSVYINKMGQVMLKMKSRHIAGTITKKKKSVVVDVCRDVVAWPGRHLLEGGEHRRYFGLKTAEGRVIEFECRNEREHEMWTQGTARILDLAGQGRRPTSFSL